MSKDGMSVSLGTIRLRVSVARSCNRVRKLCTGKPSALAGGDCEGPAEGAARPPRHVVVQPLPVLFVEEQGGKLLAHVPFDIVGQHAQKHVSADAIGLVVKDGTHVQVHALQAAKSTFHRGESFISTHDLLAAQGCCRHVGTDNVHTVERRLSDARASRA